MSIMASLDKEIRKIIMAGLGAITNTVEKSKDAIEEFVHSDGVKNMAEKGEDLFQSAVEMGKKAVDKVKDTFTEDEIEQKVREERERLTRLAREMRELSEDELKILHKLVAEGDDAVFTGDEGIGKPGVKESDHDLDVDAEKASPTAPDDDMNTAKVQTTNMNEHIQQNVPPEY